MLLRNIIAPLVAGVLLASCAGGGPPNTSSDSIFRVDRDPTLPLMQAYLGAHPFALLCAPAPQQNRARALCDYSTPAPDPFAAWDVGFAPGNGVTGITFGPYYTLAPVSFRPTLGGCIGQTAHNLVADAATLAAAAQTGYTQWQNSAGAAKMTQLLGSYAAGEIGALAFIAGTIDILGVVTVGLIVVGTGLSVYSLVQISECVA